MKSTFYAPTAVIFHFRSNWGGGKWDERCNEIASMWGVKIVYPVKMVLYGICEGKKLLKQSV